jgi:hypothetical protein
MQGPEVIMGVGILRAILIYGRAHQAFMGGPRNPSSQRERFDLLESSMVANIASTARSKRLCQYLQVLFRRKLFFA